jgi:formylglycine-generating enzyme required for sulfatase activity
MEGTRGSTGTRSQPARPAKPSRKARRRRRLQARGSPEGRHAVRRRWQRQAHPGGEAQELELGRFGDAGAVCRLRSWAQVRAGQNFPANGISFEQAQEYCAWLAKLTGQTYRVANEDEVKPIYEAASGNENTLDFWAGYSLNPDDAQRLAKRVGELGGATPLLREVGQFQGRGEEELVFDLGGNAAEWAIGADGKGKLIGGSADRAADPKAQPRDAAEAYRGFRVIRGEPKKKEEKKEE